MQSFQAMPKLDSEFVDLGKRITIPWYRLLITLWQRTGGSNVTVNGSAFVQTTGGGAPVEIVNSAGTVIGEIEFNGPGPVEQLKPLGASPFTFAAPGSGFITAFGAQIELNRSGVWHKVSLTGGSFPLRQNDQIRITWFQSQKPEVIWWPDA